MKNKARFVKIDCSVDGRRLAPEWFCLEGTWTHPYNRDGRYGRPAWGRVEEFRAWCRARPERHYEGGWGSCCPQVRIGGAVLNDGWGSDVVARLSGFASGCPGDDPRKEEWEDEWVDAIEACLADGRPRSASREWNGTSMTAVFTPFESVSPDADSVREFGPWKECALEVGRPAEGGLDEVVDAMWKAGLAKAAELGLECRARDAGVDVAGCHLDVVLEERPPAGESAAGEAA